MILAFRASLCNPLDVKKAGEKTLFARFAKEVVCVVGRSPKAPPPHITWTALEHSGLNWQRLVRLLGLGEIGMPSGARPWCPTLTRLSSNRVRLESQSRDGQPCSVAGRAIAWPMEYAPRDSGAQTRRDLSGYPRV